MSKKVQIEITYHGENGDDHKNFDIPASTSVQYLHDQIQNTISIFNSIEFILLADELVNSNNILSEDIVIGDIAITGSIKIKVLPKYVDVILTSATQDPKNITIDLTITVHDIISKIIPKSAASRFILAYEFNDKFQVCCRTLPLCAHNWWYNTEFRLLRRIYPDDIENAIDDVSRDFLYKNAQLSARCGISAYPIDIWSKLAALQLISNIKHVYKDEKEAEKKVKEIDENAIKENFSTLTSPFVFETCEEVLIPKILADLNKASQKSLNQAELDYIKLSSENGSQCSYVEEIKFKNPKKAAVNSKRFIFVSPTQISIYKDYGVTLKEFKKLDEIQTIGYEGTQTFDILFNDETKWQISHKIPATLRCLRTAIETISHITNMIDEDSKTQEKNKKAKNDKKNTKKKEEIQGEKLGLFVPSIDQNNGSIEKVETPTEVNQKEAIENQIVELKPKEDIVIDYIEGPPLTKKTPKTKNKKVKHAVIIPPSATGEDDNNPRFLDENVLHLQFLEKINVDEFHILTDADKKEIENDRFFELSPGNNWVKITFFAIILVFGFYQIYMFLTKKNTVK